MGKSKEKEPTVKDSARELRSLVKQVTDTENFELVSELRDIVFGYIEEKHPTLLDESDPYDEIENLCGEHHLAMPKLNKKAVTTNKRFLTQLKQMTSTTE